MIYRNALAALAMTVVGLLAGLSPPLALAQTSTEPAAVELPDPLTPDAINALVSRLSDQEVRDLLLKQLGAVAASQAASTSEPPPEDIGDFFLDTAERTATTFTTFIKRGPEVFAAEGKVIAAYLNQLGWSGLGIFLGVFALAIGLGALAEYLLYRFVITGRVPVQADNASRDIFDVLPILAKRLFREISGTLLFFLVGAIVLRTAMPAEDAPIAHILSRWLIVLPRISLAMLRFFFAPYRPDLRLANTDDWTARFLFRNLFGVSVAIGIAMAFLGINRHFGAMKEADGVGFWINLVVFVWLAYIFVRGRNGLRTMMLGRHLVHSPTEVKVAYAYPWFAVAVIVGIWFFALVSASMGQDALLKDGRHLVSLAVLLIAPLLDTVIRAIVLHFMPPMRGEGPVATKAYESNLRAYTRIGRVLVFGAIIIITARLWDVTPMGMATAGVGDRFATNFIQAMIISVVGYMLWEVTRLLINRRLANEMTGASGGQDASESEAPHLDTGPASRLGTILPMLSWALQAVIITLTILTALGNLGIDVTPLLAGAGVAGLAIGFGAQKLVSDIMSGMFFLIDDAFRLNEYIDTGGVQGTVEKISLRSIQLRDSKGPVLIIPYSGIDKVTNFGRDWGIMKLKFTVPFNTDIEKVRKIFKKIGQEMMDDPALAPGFIEPFKSQGVGEFNDYGIVVRGKFMHKPGAQFGIRKQIFKRVQEEFAANGIEFARREVKVSVSGGGGEHLTEEQTHQVAAAAAETVAAEERARAAAAQAKPG